MEESTIVEKKDYGYIVYAEDYYRLYALPSYYAEYDLLRNVDYLERALDAPFDFVNRALTIIETEEAYTRYKDLMHMQFNYLITQNYIYLAGLYDKENYYFYNSQFDEKALNATCKDVSAGMVKTFTNLRWRDIWRFAECITGTIRYCEWATAHGYVTETGTPCTGYSPNAPTPASPALQLPTTSWSYLPKSWRTGLPTPKC